MTTYVVDRPQDLDSVAERLLLCALRDGSCTPLIGECDVGRALVERGWAEWISVVTLELTDEGQRVAILLAMEVGGRE